MRRFDNWPIALKLTALFAVSALPLIVLILVEWLPGVEDRAFAQKREKTQHLVETAHSIVASYGAQVERGTLTTEEAQQRAAARVEALRYDGNQYFFINDLTPRMVMHPYKPELNGEDLRTLEDANGEYPFVKMVRVARSEGGGFVDYLWPKPGAEEAAPKISFVKHYEPWGWVIGSGIYVDDVEAQVATLQYGIGGLLILLLLVSVVTSWWITRRITAPVSQLQQSAQAVAEGDLEATVDIETRDEIGQLADRFNQMVASIRQGQDELAEEKARVEQRVEAAVATTLAAMERFADGDLTATVPEDEETGAIGQLYRGFNRAVTNVRRMLREVITAVDTTASTAEQIGATSNQLAAGAQEQAAQSDEVAVAMEEMSRTIVENAASTTRVAEQAEEAGRVAQENGAAVLETVAKMEDIGTVIDEAVATVERLRGSSEAIGEIVATIDEIADQTNLLALNAAIEAARAGDHGKGFAVVADEVRKLAERTGKATGEIADMIGAVQEETGSAVEVIRAGRSEVEAGITLAEASEAAFTEIVEATGTVAEQVDTIAVATEEQSTTSEQISRNIESISSVSEGQARGVTEVAQVAEDLSQLTNDLQGLADEFDVSRQREASEASAASASVAGDGARTPARPSLQ